MTAAGAVPNHAVHLGTLLGPALLLAFWATWADLRAWLRRHDENQLPTAALVAAALSTGAAVIHAIVVPPHLSESLLYGAFFLVLALAQLGWAFLVVVRPVPVVLVAGMAANVGVVLLWAATRSAGIPFGVAAGRREPVGVLDATCGLLELGVIACCVWLARAREHGPLHA
jgi:hypothetical protein